MAERKDAEKVIINVGGVRHETYKNSLKNLPGTRLALLAESVSDTEPDSVDEFFFDRDPGLFSCILNYYRTGTLSFPPQTCGCLFEKELAFWGINETDMEPCCWVSYCSHRDRIEALRKVETPDPEQQNRHQDQTCMSKMWALFNEPYSSKAAEVIAIVSLIFLLVAIASTCMSTHPVFREFQVHEFSTYDLLEDDTEGSAPLNVFFVLEAICVVWFTFEFLVRIICCPNKLLFLKNPLNTIDFVAILPFYFELRPGVHLRTSSSMLGLVRVVRFLRLLHIFRMMPDVVCVQTLKHTLKASLGCCFIASVSLAVTSFMFGSIIFYTEGLSDSDNIISIPDGAWWAVISLTTLGYGDIIPVSWLGKAVGGLCAVTGVLALALPVPALVNNFRIYHKLVAAKRKLSIKKRYNTDLGVPLASASRNVDHTLCPMVIE
ncbi:hypothetical protein GJAV_G00179030 [Gymnothorax javanicus]|nr:hypothetical protein GJAV_G00179030 [Gymnothorax javanicus]